MAEQEKELNITAEELERIQAALKNEEFRKMFVEYAKEISDPENRKKYEAEIAQMEAERGMDVKFVNPQDGFVIKTSIKGEGGKKAFINICQSDAIGEATSTFVNKTTDGRSTPGNQWSIPYSLNQSKEDVDKAEKKCIVYDVIFHPKTYQMGMEDPRFKKLIMDTSFDAIEGKWKLKLDRKNLKFPKMKFKGVKQQTIIRCPNNKGSKEPGADIEIAGQRLPYPYKDKSVEKENECALEPEAKHESMKATPKYSIVHRGHLDLQNYTNARDCRASTRPKEIVVIIELPLCKSSAGVDLDIFERQLILDSSDPLYHLDISLPYPVIEEEGSAKFDKSKRELLITLPVQPSPPWELKKHSDIEQLDANESNIGSEDNEMTEKLDHGSSSEHNLTEDVCNQAEPGTRNGYEHTEENTGETGNEAVDDSVFTVENDEENGDELKVESNDRENIDNCDETNSRRDKSSGIPCPFFNLPPYSFHQDNKTVTFVLHVSNVSIETVSLGFNKNKCCINFPTTMTSPPSLSYLGYALFIQFADDCVIDSETSKIDANETNLVLVLHKDGKCDGLWEYFLIGSQEEELEKKLFLTPKNLEKSLEQSQDLWADTSIVKTHHSESIFQDELHIELQVGKKESNDKMGNILAQAEELFEDDTKIDNDKNSNGNMVNILETGGLMELPKEVTVPVVEAAKGDQAPTGEIDDGFIVVGSLDSEEQEIEEVEVIEEKYEDYQGNYGLSTVQEIGNVSGDVAQTSRDSELQRARVIKCKKNRRRRRRSTGSHESSSVSEEEGEPGSGRKLRGKNARRLRKTRSLSLGSSTDEAEGCHGSDSGPRSVRFNLVPEVHVFSNKADKRKWKEIRRHNSLEAEDGFNNGFLPSKSALKDTNGGTGNSHDLEEVCSSLEENGSNKVDNKPLLTNQLIFDLDD